MIYIYIYNNNNDDNMYDCLFSLLFSFLDRSFIYIYDVYTFVLHIKYIDDLVFYDGLVFGAF